MPYHAEDEPPPEPDWPPSLAGILIVCGILTAIAMLVGWLVE